MCKVKWNKYTMYLSNTELVMPAGEGILHSFIVVTGEVRGLIQKGNSFIEVPRSFLTFVDWVK